MGETGQIGFSADDKINVVKTFADHQEDKLIENNENYCYIKVKVNMDKILCYMSVDGQDWIEYLSVDNFIPSENRRIGFYLWLGDDSFKNWFYSNHIQLHFRPDD